LLLYFHQGKGEVTPAFDGWNAFRWELSTKKFDDKKFRLI